MGADKQAVGSVVLVRESKRLEGTVKLVEERDKRFDVWEPLSCQRRPFQGGANHL